MPRWSTWKQHEGEAGMPRALDNLRDFSSSGFDMCCHPTEGMVLASSQSTASVLILIKGCHCAPVHDLIDVIQGDEIL